MRTGPARHDPRPPQPPPGAGRGHRCWRCRTWVSAFDALWPAADLVRAFFAELPERQREVFDLADLQGYRSSEVAELLGMNPSTVRGHLFRARRFIRNKILQSNPKLVEAYGREL